MTAKDAKEQTTRNILDKNKGKLAEIEAGIKESVKNGRYSFNYSGDVDGVLRQHLEGQGYEVGITHSFRNESNTEISWN